MIKKSVSKSRLVQKPIYCLQFLTGRVLRCNGYVHKNIGQLGTDKMYQDEFPSFGTRYR